MTNSSTYIGRFAPSPTGPLHFGSLIAALASYLDARANKGVWLIRMEDLDPAREPAGSAEIILKQLAEFGMESDRPVLYQSQRLAAYQQALDILDAKGLCYSCDCSRQQVREMGAVYDGRCRFRNGAVNEPFAKRIRVSDQAINFEDLIQGAQSQNLAKSTGDFIVKRKDGLFAYQLAVVVDDAFQQISHIIRGFDLLDSTPRQIHLQRALNYPTPLYGHVPIAINELGQKLSKQHYAVSIDNFEPRSLLHSAMEFLGLRPPESHQHLELTAQLDWAIAHWRIQAIPKLATIPQQGPVP